MKKGEVLQVGISDGDETPKGKRDQTRGEEDEIMLTTKGLQRAEKGRVAVLSVRNVISEGNLLQGRG